MLKIFWDKDNIAFIGNQVNSAEHSHCVLQAFLSLDEPLQVVVEGKQIVGKCIVVNKDVKHAFSCDGNVRLSILIEPSSGFAQELINKIDGDCLVCNVGLEYVQQKAATLCSTDDKQLYLDFVKDFAAALGIKRTHTHVLDERVTKLLQILQNCDCYDHTIENFAKSVCLSTSRLSHLFREQIGVPLKSYILFHQLERAFTGLLHGESITDAALLAGFDSSSHFAATVKKWMGTSVSASMKDSEFLKVFV